MEKPLLSAGMHWLNTCYAQWFNRQYGFKGHLFEERFHAVSVESEAHLLELLRYFALNPVRAGLCRHPGGWQWSSYRATTGRERTKFLSVEPLLELFGRSTETARAHYEAFVLDGLARAETPLTRGQSPGIAAG